MDALVSFLDTNFLGISVAVLLAFVIGIIIACYEGIKFKFRQYVETSGDSSAVFDKKYLISGVVAIILCGITVWIVFAYSNGVTNGLEADLVGKLQEFFVALMAVLTEALVLIKACNRRLDTISFSKSGSSTGKTVAAVAEEAKDDEEIELRTL